MSKDRDGFSDDENRAPGADGTPSDASAPRAADQPARDEDVLHDPETTAPDALEVEAELEAAEESAGLPSGASDDAADGTAAAEEAERAGEKDAERVESDELVGAGVGGGSRGRRGSSPAAVSAKKDAPTRARDVKDKEGLFARLSRFLREVVAELRKVIWPSRKQMITYTVVVIVFLVVMVALVSGLDVLFHLIVGNVLG